MNEHWKDQPRDERGKWIREEESIHANFSLEKAAEIKKFRISLQRFSKKGTGNVKNKPIEMPPIPPKAYGFEKGRENTKDHIRHTQEMGFKDQRQYIREAINFWDNGAGEVYFCERKTCFYKYNDKKEWMLTINPDGTIRTFFKKNKKTICQNNDRR